MGLMRLFSGGKVATRRLAYRSSFVATADDASLIDAVKI
jgi:hypothetical protein